MRVWLDDLRTAPKGWQRARTAWEAIGFCREGLVQDLSLDFDLDAAPNSYTESTGTGKDVTAWLLEEATEGNWSVVPDVIRIHSSNYEGVSEMAWDLAEIERLRWAKEMGVPPEKAW